MGAIPVGNGLSGWLRTGFGDRRATPVRRQISSGAVKAAPFAARAGDGIGLAVSPAAVSIPAARAANLPRTETNVELTYTMIMRDWLQLQPDAQYVVHPAAVAGTASALVFGLRACVAFGGG